MEFDGRLESAVAEMSEQLLVEGQPGDFVVLLRRGPVKVVTADGVGRDHVLGVAGPGDLFGELTCLDGRDQSATMVALGEVQTVKVAAGSFVGLTDARPAVAREVACLLGSRLRTTHRFWVDRNVPDVALRVVRAITTVAAVVEGGTTTSMGGGVVVSLTQEELAQLVGASPVAVQRALRRLRIQRLAVTGYGQCGFRACGVCGPTTRRPRTVEHNS